MQASLNWAIWCAAAFAVQLNYYNTAHRKKQEVFFGFLKIFCGGKSPGEKAALYFSRGIVYNKKECREFWLLDLAAARSSEL